MPYNPEIHHRRSIRLHDYDYTTEGFYFVTICSHGHIPLFGTIVNGIMHMNSVGQVVEDEYCQFAKRYPQIVCYEHVVMPNHFHAIIGISDTVGAGSACPKDETPTIRHYTLGQIIGDFKYKTTKRVNMRTPLWQRNYYEHIIRNQHSHDEIVAYILENPLHWHDDRLYVP